jgi:hypothetical protein
MAEEQSAPALFFVQEGDSFHLVQSQRVFDPPHAASSDEQKDAYAHIAALLKAGPHLVAVRTRAGDWGGHGFHSEPPRAAAAFHAEPPPPVSGGQS